MPSTRSSTRRAVPTSSSPASSQDASTGIGAPAIKRKGGNIAEPESKRGKKENGKAQTKIEDVMPVVHDADPVTSQGNSTQETDGKAVTPANQQMEQLDNQEKPDESKSNVGHQDPASQVSGEGQRLKEGEIESMEIDPSHAEPNGLISAESKTEDNETANPEKTNAADEPPHTAGAVLTSAKREETTPSSILEKGLIYFFFRGRVGIDEPSDVGELARSYIVLRPIPHGAKLGQGPLNDEGNNRLLTLPKKVLPASEKDKFMVFVEKANVTTEEIKSTLKASEYSTQTVGTRHTPSATPIGEGIYAVTSTGRETHLAYTLTIPSSLNEVQRDVGLRERGSFVTSVKNPTYPGPANTNLPQSPEFSQEILDEFRSRRWMPLEPKILNYENAQFLLIGNAETDSLEKATIPQPEDKKQNKDSPMEEIEKLEHEDELRVQHLKGDDSIFDDLGLSAKEYSRVQTTW